MSLAPVAESGLGTMFQPEGVAASAVFAAAWSATQPAATTQNNMNARDIVFQFPVITHALPES
jgi:hypothetical protein